MKVIHVLRKPVTASSIAANVLEHGTGALHIDAGRIKVMGEVINTPQSDPRERAGTVGTDLGFTRKDPKAFQEAQRASIERTMTLGRWPANMILVHKTECVPAGVHTVGRGSGTREARDIGTVRHDGDESWRLKVGKQEAPRGREGETTLAWECAVACPVPDLDVQGEAMGAHSAGSTRAAKREAGKTGMFQMDGDGHRFGDSGGVSRFFKQVR